MPTEKRQRQKEGRAARQAALEAYRRKSARRRQLITMVVIIALVFLVVALISRGGNDDTVTAGATTTTTAPTPTTLPPAKGDSKVCPAVDGSSARATEFEAPPATCIDPAKTYTAKFDTDVGSFTVALDAIKAPKTVNNFVFLARYHFFDGSLFHRVIPGFVVQGGDANKGDGTGDAGYKIPDEFPQQGEFKVGSVAMANSGQPNSGGTQFFVIVGEQGLTLPPSYTLFGAVTEGIEVAHTIEKDGESGNGTPKVFHQIIKVTITEV